MANDLLLKAARGGDVAGMVDAIDKGAVPDARSGSRSEIWALTGKPDYSPSGASGLQEENWTPLFHAVSAGYLPAVKCLVAAGADVNAQDAAGAMPIMYAIWKARPEVVEYLARHQASAKEPKYGMTMMMLAAFSGCEKCVEALLAAGHGVEDRMEDGHTALSITMYSQDPEAASRIISLLKAKGADTNAKNNQGQTALVELASKSGSAAQPERAVTIARALLNAGADLGSQDNSGSSALSYAAEGCQPMLAGFLAGRIATLPNSAPIVQQATAIAQKRVAAAQTLELTSKPMPDGALLVTSGFRYENGVRASAPPNLSIEEAQGGVLAARGKGMTQAGAMALQTEGGLLVAAESCELACSVGAKWVFAKPGISFRNQSHVFVSKEAGALIEFRDDGVLLKGFDVRNAELEGCREALRVLNEAASQARQP